MGEGVFHLAADEYGVRHLTYETKSNFKVDYIADQSAGYSIARVCGDLVAVMPAFERTFVLDIGEVVVPFEFGDAGDSLCADRQKREDAERGRDVDPMPADLSAGSPVGGAGGGMRLSAIRFVWLAAGMMRGRFSGFEKKAKTWSRGKGTHCSNSR